jgi:hypothetical protein
MRRLIKNRKGTAEVIGTIMFVVILLFFFTNVYLWHDAATKDANQLYLKQINSTFKIEQTAGTITVTANGGSNIILSRLWIVEPGASCEHLYADLGNAILAAGTSFTITFAGYTRLSNSPDQVVADPPRGNNIVVYYAPAPGQSITCTVINTLGITESTTFQP